MMITFKWREYQFLVFVISNNSLIWIICNIFLSMIPLNIRNAFPTSSNFAPKCMIFTIIGWLLSSFYFEWHYKKIISWLLLLIKISVSILTPWAPVILLPNWRLTLIFWIPAPCQATIFCKLYLSSTIWSETAHAQYRQTLYAVSTANCIKLILATQKLPGGIRGDQERTCSAWMPPDPPRHSSAYEFF